MKNFLIKNWVLAFTFCFGFLSGVALARTTVTIMKFGVLGIVGVTIISIALLMQKKKEKLQ